MTTQEKNKGEEDTDYQEMMTYSQWLYRTSKDWEPEALVVTKKASMALERNYFTFRSVFTHSLSSNLTGSVSDSETFTPSEIILLELYAEV